MADFNFTTGPSQLPDVGTLSYNSCFFSPLFSSDVSGIPVKDNAQRTIKYMEYTIKVEGYVTLPEGATDINPTTSILRKLLSAQGGALTYKGRGYDFAVNGGNDLDVMWGPTPEILDFQPLGGGRSAKISWQVKIRISERKRFTKEDMTSKNNANQNQRNRFGLTSEMLQFNYETSVSYNEDGYSTLNIDGTIEIPLTRAPNQAVRTLQKTADDLRTEINDRIMRGIDLTKFRAVNRNFKLSRDKRTLEWQMSFQELTFMQPPVNCTMANGSFTIRPAKQGMGLVNWLCTLRASYVVRKDESRRWAWYGFFRLLQRRMMFAFEPFVNRSGIPNPKQDKPKVVPAFPNAAQKFDKFIKTRACFLVDFNVDEGLYLDSKTTTFSATWRLVTQFDHILLGSGLWKRPYTRTSLNDGIWATTMENIQGSNSWLPNRVDPQLDVIVDFGPQ